MWFQLKVKSVNGLEIFKFEVRTFNPHDSNKTESVSVVIQHILSNNNEKIISLRFKTAKFNNILSIKYTVGNPVLTITVNMPFLENVI